MLLKLPFSKKSVKMSGHEGLRPLSPHGEGYCRTCHFVVGLTDTGKLETHSRGSSMSNVHEECKGSHRKPAPVTPVTSRAARFTCEAPVVRCWLCNRDVPLLYDGRYGAHSKLNGVSDCPASLKRSRQK